ncbi:MAG: aspartate aminotransferase family protein [Candidatus Hydrogenedentota bacterium]|nr:MAG: aspartate aminotransferase family protein [Candidatus Hydrogenedentota bacterium]
MSRNEEIRAEHDRYVLPTYGRIPIAFESGRGITLTDADGREYQDFLAGLAVCSLGHNHPALVEALQTQAAKLLHTSNLFLIANQSKLARYLVDLSFPGKVFFCNSGAEANEAALKLARRYQTTLRNAPDRTGILAFERSFHGRTFASLSVTGQTRYHEGFAPLLPDVHFVPFNDSEAVGTTLDAHPEIGTIIVELIQAEGGIYPAEKSFIESLAAEARERDIVLIFDEVQTGMGRTGTFFAWQQYGVQPDVMTLAKGLAGGIPIGAIVVQERVAAALTPGTHASTFGGNPFSTAAAIAVIKTLLNDQLVERARARGEFLLKHLAEASPQHVVEVRGRGLLIGIELDGDAASIVAAMREKGFLIGTAGTNVLRITPPLIVSENQCRRLLDALLPLLESGS